MRSPPRPGRRLRPRIGYTHNPAAKESADLGLRHRVGNRVQAEAVQLLQNDRKNAVRQVMNEVARRNGIRRPQKQYGGLEEEF